MSIPSVTTLKMIRGDNKIIEIGPIVDKDGVPIDLTGRTITFTARRDDAIIMQKTTPIDVVIRPQVSTDVGYADAMLDPADTASFPARLSTLSWDVELIAAGGKYTVGRGDLLVYPDTTFV